MPNPHTPAWAVLPFVSYLLSIAALPLFAGRFWESNRNKLLLACAASTPVLVYLPRWQPHGGPLLFLGFLRGVPFLWTLRLVLPWAVINGALLTIFTLIDRAYVRRDPPPAPLPPSEREPLMLEGRWNLLCLGGVVLTVFV